MIKASKLKRILALTIDFLICTPIIGLILGATIPGIIELIFDEKGITILGLWSFLEFTRWMIVAMIFFFAYFTLLPVIIPGQTLGKKLLKIKVIKKNGDNVTFTTMFVREIIGRVLFDFTSLLVTMLLSVLLMVSPYHETLHDTLAETMVIEK